MEDKQGGKRQGSDLPLTLHLQKGTNKAGSPAQHAAGWDADLELHTPLEVHLDTFPNSSQEQVNFLRQMVQFRDEDTEGYQGLYPR